MKNLLISTRRNAILYTGIPLVEVLDCSGCGRQTNKPLLFLLQKKMYSLPYSFAFCDVVLFAIQFQLFLCFIIKAYTKALCFWVIYLWPSCWADFSHLLNLHHTFIIFISHLNVKRYFYCFHLFLQYLHIVASHLYVPHTHCIQS